MKDIHLSELLKIKTQQEVADILGVTQGAVHQMHKAGRDIFFNFDEGGEIDFFEIKKPRRKKAA